MTQLIINVPDNISDYIDIDEEKLKNNALKHIQELVNKYYEKDGLAGWFDNKLYEAISNVISNEMKQDEEFNKLIINRIKTHIDKMSDYHLWYDGSYGKCGIFYEFSRQWINNPENRKMVSDKFYEVFVNKVEEKDFDKLCEFLGESLSDVLYGFLFKRENK